MTEPFIWSGEQEILVTGTKDHEDTLRIQYTGPIQKDPLYLVLPTLCITYADMKFANAIGGQQQDYPRSAVYGSDFFDPPVEIRGAKQVQQHTWIRGASAVTIGPKETTVEYYGHSEVVIPRLRVAPGHTISVRVAARHMVIPPGEESVVDITQWADGRPLGGNAIHKRHPDFQPADRAKQPWSLWVKVINGKTREPVPAAQLHWTQWVAHTRGPRPTATNYTGHDR